MKMKLSFIVSFIILIISIIIVQFLITRPKVIVIKKGFDRFPSSFDNYSGENIKMNDRIVKELDADVYVYRNYRRNSPITLYVGYYGTEKGGRTGHNPNACYPSSGHAILEERKVLVPVNYNDGKSVKVLLTRLLVKKNSERQIVYHWYQSAKNSILSNGIEQNLNRFKNRLFHNRNDGAFVRVSSAIKIDAESTDMEVLIFIKTIIPLLSKHWPVEQDFNVRK